MKLNQQIIIELFSDNQFSSLLGMKLDPDYLANDVEAHNFPYSWDIDEIREDMDDSIYKTVRDFKNDSQLFYVNVTSQYDTNFSFYVVKRKYKDLLVWTLNYLEKYYDDLHYFDPTNYDEFNSSKHEED